VIDRALVDSVECVKAEALLPHSKRPLDLGGGAGDGQGWCGWSQGQGDPEDEVEQAARACAEDGKQPDDADECGIEVEIVGDARADAADFFIAAGAHQALGWSGITSCWWRGLACQLGAAVVTEL